MLRSMKNIENYSIGATNGIIGHVQDFYFYDESWVIRYLVVETDEGQPRRRVLISPIAIGRPNWSIGGYVTRCSSLRDGLMM